MTSTADRPPPGDGVDQAMGVWLHGVAHRVDPATLNGVAGMDDGRLSVIRAAGLAAVVSGVPLAQYGEEPLRQNLEDLSWLERAARAHHIVVDALWQAGPFVPARLATVFLDEARVAELLTTRRTEFVAGLERVAGRAEWGVKAYAVAMPDVQPQDTPDSVSPGLAYLRKRRAELTAQTEGQERAARDAAAVHAALAECAAAARRHAPQDRRLSGADTAMVLNGAYLVDPDRLTEFTELVATLPKRHPAVRLELTGPWPPYSFAGDETPLPGATEPVR
jgi:hypothetical protein